MSYWYFRPLNQPTLSLAYLFLYPEISNHWRLHPIDLANRSICQIGTMFPFEILQFIYLSKQSVYANSFSACFDFQYQFEALEFNRLKI